MSVNCDARIKETVTPGEKESRKREEREVRGKKYGRRPIVEVEEGERRIFGGFAVVNNAL